MCNMAAYAGHENAAEILLKMLEAQEGLNGGHFSGIATLHEGKIYCAKVCGSVAELRGRTDAEHLPGTVGIAHSRTPGYAADEWAQPFLSYGGKAVYCANGVPGIFQNTKYDQIYTDMKKQGIVFPSELPHACPWYPTMPNGHCVHFSELMSNIAARNMGSGLSLSEALEKAVYDFPAEIALLALCCRESGQVSGLRMNQPLSRGKKGNGMMLATSALALEAVGSEFAVDVPSCSSFILSADKFTAKSFDPFAALLPKQKINAFVNRSLDRMLAEKEYAVCELYDALAQQLPQGRMYVLMEAIYGYLCENLANGNIRMRRTRKPGSGKGLSAPVFLFRGELAE